MALLAMLEEHSRRLQLLESRSLTNPKQDYIFHRMIERRHIDWSDVADDEEGNRLFKGVRQDFYYHIRRVASNQQWKEVRLSGRRTVWAIDDSVAEDLKTKALLVPNRGRLEQREIGPDEVKGYFDDVRTGPSDGLRLRVNRWLEEHHPDWNDDLRLEFLKQCKIFADAGDEFEQVQKRSGSSSIMLNEFRLKRARSK